MKKLIIIPILTICSLTTAQTSTNTSGGVATGTGGTASYTIGQVIYTEATGTGGTSSQGVQQPYETFEDATAEGILELDVLISLYPNPTTDMIIIQLNEVNSNMTYTVYDSKGASIASSIITDKQTTIPMHNRDTGVYVIHIKDKENRSKSFRIVKNK